MENWTLDITVSDYIDDRKEEKRNLRKATFFSINMTLKEIIILMYVSTSGYHYFYPLNGIITRKLIFFAQIYSNNHNFSYASH